MFPGGYYDDDDFFILQDGDFFDPFGYYFNEFGMDADSGHFDDNGYYIPGKKRATQRATQLKSFSKVEIETNQGEYDKDGFFLLEDQSFYDPLGFYFNYKGFDEVGGYYDHYGLYINAKEEDEEYYDDYDLYGQSEKEYYDDLDDYGQSEED